LSTKYIIVVTAFSRAATGKRIVDSLLAAKLAACIQVLPIRSFYPWKGKISRDRENLMLIKSRSRDFGAVKRTILEYHDYELPEIISVRIDRGSAAYLRWMERVMR
jgi:periplasmic divalent cation tolerance protein